VKTLRRVGIQRDGLHRQLPDVADAGMISDANMKAIEAAGLSFILGMKVPDVPYAHDQWRREHPGQEIPDGHVFIQPWPAGPRDKRRDQVIYHQYRADRARRTLHGIDEQVAKAAKAVAGLAPVKRNRFIVLGGAVKSLNRELEEKARTLAGIKGYKTNLAVTPDGEPVTADFVIGSYHELWNIEKSFRTSKHDLRARPVYHRKRESIDAHLTVVFAALAVTRFIETRTGVVHQRICPDRPPPPHHPDPRRPAHHHRRRPAPARSPRRPRAYLVTANLPERATFPSGGHG
jgi:hypothetical protein